MTNAEKQQPFGSFRNAGYNAFHLAHQDDNTRRIIQPANPYRIKPFDDLWLKGWRDGEREFRMGLPFRHSPFSDDVRLLEDRKPKQKFIPRGNFKPRVTQPSRLPYKVGPTVQHPQIGKSKAGPNLTRLENRFNKKRTAV